MTFNPNIPAPNDLILVSQGDLLNDFQAINTQYGTSGDHVAFDAASNNGKHKKATYIEQSSDPSTAANEGAIYSKESSLTSQTEMYFRRESDGTVIEWTGRNAATNGWTRLPSGILLKWGTDTKSGNATVTFPTGGSIPAFTAIYQILLTVEDSSGSPNSFVYLKSISTASFDVNCVQRTALSSSSATFRYLAIGI